MLNHKIARNNVEEGAQSFPYIKKKIQPSPIMVTCARVQSPI
jgi:hypothetical protein